MAERIAPALGVGGNVVLTRIFGLVLGAVAAQFVIDGIGAIGN